MNESRFWSKVNKTDDCWTWTAALNEHGYGIFRTDNAGPTRRAHRIAWELLVGRIPAGLVLDHLCRNKACVNPAHLEPVSVRENTRRHYQQAVTHCPRGHAYTDENTYLRHDRRNCRACNREKQAERKARRRLAPVGAR